MVWGSIRLAWMVLGWFVMVSGLGWYWAPLGGKWVFLGDKWRFWRY